LVLLTAWEALHDRARLVEGQRVLIHGGAGGVGHVAIQLAKAAGARICTTISSPEKADFAHALGAEYCINYLEEDLVEAVMDWSEGEGVDIALDTVGPEVFRRTIPAVAHYGDLVTILDPGPELDLKEARLRNLRISLELMLTPMLRDLPRARTHQGDIAPLCQADRSWRPADPGLRDLPARSGPSGAQTDRGRSRDWQAGLDPGLTPMDRRDRSGY
jgi:NADPH2:quinone reductase